MEKHILISDDSPLIRKTLRQVLEKEDSWVVVGEAENGKEAIEKAQELKPDLVILDLSMPVMNGIRAARELKRVMPATPLVMFTNMTTPDLAQMVLSSGVNAVISKSEAGVLVRRIYDLLESAA